MHALIDTTRYCVKYCAKSLVSKRVECHFLLR